MYRDQSEVIEDADLSKPLIEKLSNVIKEASKEMNPKQARMLVQAYYGAQDVRKTFYLQKRDLEKNGSASDVVDWGYRQYKTLERYLLGALDLYSNNQIQSKWARQFPGCGPVTSSALMAFTDIEKATTVGKLWRFFGYDKTIEWLGKKKSEEIFDSIVKGKRVKSEELISLDVAIGRQPGWLQEKLSQNEKSLTKTNIVKQMALRPYNETIKNILWNFSESLVKVMNREDDVYGKYYLMRKQYEWPKNLKGEYEKRAEYELSKKDYDENKDGYRWMTGYYSPEFLNRATGNKWLLSYGTPEILTADGMMQAVWDRIRTKKPKPNEVADNFIDLVLDGTGLQKATLAETDWELKEIKEIFKIVIDHGNNKKRLINIDWETYSAFGFKNKVLRAENGNGVKMLMPGHIHERCKHWMVQRFLSHWWQVCHEAHYRRKAPVPWIIEHGGHKDYIPAPRWDSEIFEIVD